jgi:hypothetical protein
MYILKSVILGVLLFLILFPVDQGNAPQYNAEQVSELAKANSPECELKTCG